MNSALYFAKLDMLSFKPYRKYLLMLPLAIVVIFQTPILATQFIMFLMLTSLAPYLFASEEKNAMQRLYALLPIGIKDMVWGRYICCIIGALLYIFAMALIQCVCSIFTGLSILNSIYSMIACTGLFLFSTAVQFPIFFKVGFIKGKFFALAPSFILFGIIIALRQFIGIDLLSDLTILGVLNSIFLLVIGIIAILISIGASIRLYQNREG